jgi:hypothetical protein
MRDVRVNVLEKGRMSHRCVQKWARVIGEGMCDEGSGPG